MTAMLTLQTRHSKKCRENTKKTAGRNKPKCRCPVWVCGMADGRRVRISLKTRDLQRAARRLTEMEDRLSGKPRKTIIDAVNAFHGQHEKNGDETKRRYKRVLRYFIEFCRSYPLTYVDQADVEAMDSYAVTRNTLRSWNKDVELLVQLFEFCRDRGWTTKNPARALRIPKLEATDVVPYTRDEVVKIIAACDGIGKSSYERRRARAMTLVMRFAGLRISDVVTLSREHIKGRRLEKRAVKNKKWIRVELPAAVIEALDVLPSPKATAGDNKRFFYSDTTGLRTLVKAAWRTMNAVFKRSGVVGAHPHRFRHTLASELLGKGGSIEELAGILGDSSATISRYYAKWTEEYQSRQDTLIRKIHDTNLAQAEEQASN